MASNSFPDACERTSDSNTGIVSEMDGLGRWDKTDSASRRGTKIIERPIENNRKSTLNNERKVAGS